jgi:hypothetical protein
MRDAIAALGGYCRGGQQEESMNAAGLTAILSGVSGQLSIAFFGKLVTEGHIKQDELDGTRKLCVRVIADLKQIPHDKIEALVSHFDSELTKYSNDFNAKGAADALGQFRDAQILLGFVSSILAKAGIRE